MTAQEPSLDFEDIRQHCIKTTGLSDFGGDYVLETFRRLTKSWDEEGEMTAHGRAAKRASVIRSLTNRLKLEQLLKEHPEILEEKIVGPLVIVGLPRSGTTKLHRMMSADPGSQKLPVWKVLNPVPLGPVAPGATDPRITIAQDFEALMRKNQPDLFAAHPVLALEPDEDVFALETTGKVYTNCSAVRSPSFKTWLDQQPFDDVYRWLKRYLQIAQFLDRGQGKPWVLKAPQHMGFLQDLFRYFPDATIIHCHRPPAVNIASYTAMITSSRRSMCYRVDPNEVGQYGLNFWSGLMNRYLRDRPGLESAHRFVDISYRDIVENGLKTISAIYKAAGLPLTEEGKAAMLAWETANSQHKHGRHKYSLADAGLTDEDVDRAFALYEAKYARCY